MINGSKTFITNGLRANYIVLVAKTDPDAGHDGISLFIVDIRDEDGKEVEGFSVSRKLEKMGMHASDTGELSFQDVRVPAENLLGQEGKGFYHISWELQGERLVAAIGCVSGAERVFDRTLEYAKEREAFGRPIGRFQAIRHKFAEMSVKIEAAKQMVYATAWRFANGEYPVREITQAKLYASRVIEEVADDAHPDPRRLRLHEGVRGRARLPRLPPQPHRRRHRRDHARGDRAQLRALGRRASDRWRPGVDALVAVGGEVLDLPAPRSCCRAAAGPSSPSSIASSRLAQSIRQKPPSCSLVSAKGPSVTAGAPPSSMRTVLAVFGSSSASLAISTPASTASWSNSFQASIDCLHLLLGPLVHLVLVADERQQVLHVFLLDLVRRLSPHST